MKSLKLEPLCHKVHTYKEYHSICPLVGIGTPHPSPASEYLPPPEPKGGREHSPACEGVGVSQFRRLEKSLALCLHCALCHMSSYWKTSCPEKELITIWQQLLVLSTLMHCTHTKYSNEGDKLKDAMKSTRRIDTTCASCFASLCRRVLVRDNVLVRYI